MTMRPVVRLAGVALAGVALAAALCMPAAMVALSAGSILPPCPQYTLRETGGRHGTPRFVSFKRADFEAYTEAVRLHARGECRVIVQGEAPSTARTETGEN